MSSFWCVHQATLGIGGCEKNTPERVTYDGRRSDLPLSDWSEHVGDYLSPLILGLLVQ